MSKVIVITGVSKGLGYNLAKRYTEDGHTVAGCSRSGGGPDIALLDSVDVSDANAVSVFVEKVTAEIGAPDIIINNAAVMNTKTELWNINTDEFQQLIDINVVGSFNVIKAFYPRMTGGVIVNISSGWGRATSPHVAPYCASKYAIEGMSMAMAQEVASGFAVVSLNPGFIDTEMVQGIFGEDSGAESLESWVERASEFITNIRISDNGKQLTV